MSDDILKKLEEMEKKATPGPWVNRPSGIVQRQGGSGPIIFWDDHPKTENKDWKANYELIAETRTALPVLIAVIREQQKAIEFYAEQEEWDKAEINDGGLEARETQAKVEQMLKEI